MNRYIICGLTIAAGAALLEVALVPGIVLGAAAVLAPEYLPKLRRHLSPPFNPSRVGTPRPAVPVLRPRHLRLPSSLAPFKIKQAVAKTITFRIIVTTLDFSSNYLVIGEVATAAGLSTFSLIAGPLFYLAHETAWNYLGGPAETGVDVSGLLSGRRDAYALPVDRGGFTISRALAKTITFRTIATVMDFTTNYVVVRDVATAAGLSAFGFVLGPFVYFGHEWVWDYYGSLRRRALAPPPVARERVIGANFIASSARH